ncbi:MAG: hypothetical protein ACUVR6_09650, partial [Anaerolineae bacterium]
LDNVREEWSAFDLITPEGITVEVKSAAYIQSWSQRNLSSITFRTPKTRAWNADTNVQEKEPRRQAQVYVFALLAHQDKSSIDPLNVDQWKFFVVPTAVLDARTRSQHLITLRSLEKLSRAFSYDELRDAVRAAAEQRTEHTLTADVRPAGVAKARVVSLLITIAGRGELTKQRRGSKWNPWLSY